MPPIFLSWFMDVTPLLLAIGVSSFVFPPRTLFDLHPLLVITGAVLVMPWAVRALDRDVSWMPQKSRAIKIRWHWILQLVGGLFICCAATAVFMNKTLYGKPHYSTWHGLMGLFTVLYIILVMSCGFVMHWKLWPIGHWLNYGTARQAHMYFGCGLIALIGLTTVLGLRSHWFSRQLTSTLGDKAVLGSFILLSMIAFLPTIRILLQVYRIRFRQLDIKSN